MVSIVVHGGAWAIPDTIATATKKGVEDAARVGYEVLRAGGSAIDAVQVRPRLLQYGSRLWVTEIRRHTHPPNAYFSFVAPSVCLSVRPPLRAWRVTQYLMQVLGQY